MVDKTPQWLRSTEKMGDRGESEKSLGTPLYAILIFELYKCLTYLKILIQLNTRGKRKWEIIPGARAKNFSLLSSLKNGC